MDVADLTEQEAFKAGFLAFCKEAGLSDAEAVALVKQAAFGLPKLDWAGIASGLNNAGLRARVAMHRAQRAVGRLTGLRPRRTPPTPPPVPPGPPPVPPGPPPVPPGPPPVPPGPPPVPPGPPAPAPRGGGAARTAATAIGSGGVGAGIANWFATRGENVASRLTDGTINTVLSRNALLALLGLPVAGGLAAGGGLGWAAAKMNEPNVRDEDIRAEEIEQVYKTQAKRLKARRDYEKYRQARGL